MDNFKFDITNNGYLGEALIIAFAHHRLASHWRVKDNTLQLAWTKPSEGTWQQFLVKVGPHEVKPLIVSWLADEADYGHEPDHDGDNGKGFRIYCEDWGHIDHQWEVFVAIEPRWAMYGK